MWRVSNTDGRWMAYNGHTWDADPGTRVSVELAQQAGLPVPIGPTGPLYEATGPNDVAWLYLAARQVIDAATVTGAVPRIPMVPAPDPDVVY